MRQVWKVAHPSGLCPALHNALHNGVDSKSVAALELVEHMWRCCQAESPSLRPPSSEPTEQGERLLLDFGDRAGFTEKKCILKLVEI